MSNLGNRLDRLEQATRTGCVFIWAHHTETDDQAKARWKTEHRGEDLERPGLAVTVVCWGDPQ